MEKLLKIPYNVFYDWDLLQQFLERRGNPKYELVGDVDLNGKKNIYSLGNLFQISGNLILSETSITTLGYLNRVYGNLFIYDTPIDSLGSLNKVDGNLYLVGTRIKSLSNLKYVGGDLSLVESPIKSIGNLEYVGGEFWLSKNHQLPENLLYNFKIVTI